MPKIVSYKPQSDQSDNEVDIADQYPPEIVIEACEDIITLNKLTRSSGSKTPSPSLPKRIIRSSSESRKNGSKRHKPKDHSTAEIDICRISMPCNTGCCYCTYANKLGPVKVFVSSFDQEKDKFIKDIKDGRGKNIIPTSRKADIKGLVFDKKAFSFHPPCELGKNGVIKRDNRR